EQCVQEAQRKAAFVVPRADANSNGELQLRGLLCGEADLWSLLVRLGLQEVGALSRRDIWEEPLHGALHAGWVDVAGDGNHHRRSDIIVPAEFEELFAAKAIEGFFSSGQRAAQGMIGPHDFV